MTNSYMPYVASDRLSEGYSPQEQNGPRINMSDHNIRSVFQRTTDHSAVVNDDHISFGSAFPNDGAGGGHMKFSDHAKEGGNQDRAVISNETTGDGTTGKGTLNRCETSSTDSTSTGNGDSSVASSGQDQFLQQLSTTDPNLATMLTDAQSTMSPAGAAQLEQNVSNNFNNNNGQFPTDSSLMNASIGQLGGQNIPASDITAAQNSVSADVSNPNIGDAPVSTFSSSASGSSSDSSGSSSCDSSGGSSDSGSSDSSSPLQQDISQLMQDLESGNMQQFLSDLINDLPTLLGQSSGSGDSGSSGSGGSGSPDSGGSSSETPAPTTTDGSTPITSPTPSGTPNPLGQQLANSIVKNDGTAQASTVATVQQTLEYGTPQAVLQALQQNGTQITVTGTDIGSAGENNGTNQIVITDNPNDTPANEVAEATAHEANEIWSNSTGFTSTPAFQAAAQQDLSNLPAGALNNLPIQLVDAPVATAADGTQVGLTDVVSELSTNIAANQTGDTNVAASGEGATLAQLFPNINALVQQGLA